MGKMETSPPDAVLRLVLPYLDWGELVKNCDLVCGRWRRVLEEDDVWRPMCDLQLERDRRFAVNCANRRRMTGEVAEEREFISPHHEILSKQMESGQPFRDIYILSRKLGDRLWQHKHSGPDTPIKISAMRDTKSLREYCIQDYQRIIEPTIITLRQVFDDPEKELRRDKIVNIFFIKMSLLRHARNNPALTRSTIPNKEELLLAAGRYLTSISKQPDDSIFVPSSMLQATVGEMTQLIETTKRKEDFENDTPRGNLSGIDWPMNPVDCISFMIYSFWPRESNLDYPTLGMPMEERETIWNNVVLEWWAGLSEVNKNVLVSIHGELADRYTDVEHLPQGCSTDKVPIDALKMIVESSYRFVRQRIADIFWRDINPCIRGAIFKSYRLHVRDWRDMIREQYRFIHENRVPEVVAGILLDIFLEVRPDGTHTDASVSMMTSEHCSGLFDEMMNAMDRWDDLARWALSDENVMWDPQTIEELRALESKFVMERMCRTRNPTLDFCPQILVERFLYQTLSSEKAIPCSHWSLKNNLKKVFDDGYNEDGSKKDMTETENAKNNSSFMKVSQEYITLSQYTHAREHAMMALIPLLQDLSERDCKRLIYAMFIASGDKFVRSEFKDLYADGIPCAQNKLPDDLVEGLVWAKVGAADRYTGYDRHGVRSRLFGLPLPENIINAMCQFFLDRLYRRSIYDVNSQTLTVAQRVLPYLERFCYESPTRASIVWDCLGQAIQNINSMVQDNGLDAAGVGERELETFQNTIFRLWCSCVGTRAMSTIPVIRRFYEISWALLPPGFLPLETIVQRITEAPMIPVDTRSYHLHVDSVAHDDSL